MRSANGAERFVLSRFSGLVSAPAPFRCVVLGASSSSFAGASLIVIREVELSPPSPTFIIPPVILPEPTATVFRFGAAILGSLTGVDGAPGVVLGAACRFAAGVWKKVEAGRLFWVALGRGCVEEVGAAPEEGEVVLGPSLESSHLSQPESMCWLISSRDLTPLLQIGQTTIPESSKASRSQGGTRIRRALWF